MASKQLRVTSLPVVKNQFISSNWAGGTGLYEGSGAFAVAAKAGLERRSLHLANMGLVMMHRCVFEGAVIAPVSDVAERNGGTWFIVGQDLGRLVLNQSKSGWARAVYRDSCPE